MAKIIKVIDLLNLITKCEQPMRIEVLGHKFSWNSLEGFYEEVNDRNDLFELTSSYPSYEFLDFEVKIENKKEQQDIDIQNISNLTYKGEKIGYGTADKMENEVDDYCNAVNNFLDSIGIKINELIQAVKQLDKDINAL